ncbi:MAG TPA: hypothetical protein VFS00_04855 [Polyangiaceae bacterium]|nr:hypothetical protein [Polyangiaceae bacterium]
MLEEKERAAERIGTVTFGEDLASFRSRGEVLRDFVVALLVTPALLAAVAWWAWPAPATVALGLVSAVAYGTFSFLVRFRPNHDNLGAGGGLFDHPFRFSDDVNRGLLALAVVFAPGRFLATGLVQGMHYLTTGKLPHERLLAALDRQP